MITDRDYRLGYLSKVQSEIFNSRPCPKCGEVEVDCCWDPEKVGRVNIFCYQCKKPRAHTASKYIEGKGMQSWIELED